MTSMTNRFEHAEAPKRAAPAVAPRIRRWGACVALSSMVSLLLLPVGAAHAAPTVEQRLAALEAKITALETKLAHFSRVGNEIYITGANLNIRNGMGGTGTKNGLGNLIIGSNELRGDGSPNDRTGSGNLVVGPFHNYPSIGGVL